MREQLMAELESDDFEPVVAYRGAHRWVQTFEAANHVRTAIPTNSRLRDEGVYLITGGLGSIGQVLAEHLERCDPIVHVSDIETAVATYFGVTPAAIHSAKKDRTITLARHMAMYLTRKTIDVPKRAVIYVTLAGLSLAFLFPFYWLAVSAFKTQPEIFATPPTWRPTSESAVSPDQFGVGPIWGQTLIRDQFGVRS